VGIAIGSTIGGYTLEQELGSGGMGAVYVARHPTLPRRVALKVLHPAFSHEPELRARFEREADLLCALDHPNVVDVLDRGQDGDLLWIAMRLIDGPDLHTALHQRGPFPPAQALAVVEEVGRALDHAHVRRLLHRDVKPHNILLRRRADGTEEAVLTDFGIAKDLASASALTQQGAVPATVAYAAPEQVEGRFLDRRADVYSLGAVLFELLTGRRAFPMEDLTPLTAAVVLGPVPDPRSVRPDLPPALAAVVVRALAKRPEDRFGTCAELVAAARAAIAPPVPRAPATTVGGDGAPPPPPPSAPVDEPPTRSETVPEPPRRWRRLLPVALAAVLVVVAAVVVGVVVASRGGNGGASGTTPTPPTTVPSAVAAAPTAASTAPATAESTATALAPGDCVDAAGAPAPCDAPHAAEVYSAGGCATAALVGYLGGTPGEDPLTRLLTVGTAASAGGTVCTVTGPEPTRDRSDQGVLPTSDGGVWRRCTDTRGNDVLCTGPHAAEVVFDRSEAADTGVPLNCRERAGSYLGKPYDQVAGQLGLLDDPSRCLLVVRGDNVLTASLHGLRSSALPIEAAAD